jgi:hypothetical protein
MVAHHHELFLDLATRHGADLVFNSTDQHDVGPEDDPVGRAALRLSPDEMLKQG